MEYEQFILEIPNDTKKLILKTMDIYSSIENKDIICNTYHDFKFNGEQLISLNDKRCISLFLAGLVVEGDAKKVLESNGVTIDGVLNFLGLNKEEIKLLTNEQYKDYFEKDFEILLDKIKITSTFEYDFYLDDCLIPEAIISNLAYRYVCGSDIINWLYKDAEWENVFPAFEHNSYLRLKELEEEKLNKMGLKKKELEDNNPIEEIIDYDDEVLEEYGELLTKKEFLINPAIGRDNEIKNLILSLFIPEKSAMLVGEAGVGKTAIVEGLAYLIKNKKVPKRMKNIKILQVTTSSVVRGSMFVGMFEEKVETMIQELVKRPDVILFIDEIHNVIGAGSGLNKDMDFADILKPYLDRGKIKMIGATTVEEYEKHILRDSAFKRRFERINVLEPKEVITNRILDETISKLEKVTNIKFDFDLETKKMIINHIVNSTTKKHRVYNDNINNPDLSLTILKKSFAYAALYDLDKVEVEHVADAIRTCERIYEETRYKRANNLLTAVNEKKENEPVTLRKVIPFSAKY